MAAACVPQPSTSSSKLIYVRQVLSEGDPLAVDVADMGGLDWE